MFDLYEMDRDELNKRFNERCEMAVEAERLLNKHDVYGDAEPMMYGTKDISVEIHWGDWKHEHLRCDWVLGLIGFSLVSVDVTEENGSDCYSAIRYYRKGA